MATWLTPERRTALKNAAAVVLCAVGAPPLARARHRNRLSILMFHGVEPKPLTPPCWHVIDVAAFRRQLVHLRDHFHVLPLAEGLELLAAGTLPPRAVALTFDDGTRNLATQALPVLRELQLPAAVFLTTGPMGTSEALWADRLWLGFARSTLDSVDLTSLGLGTHSLADASKRGKAYAAAAGRLKDLPDDQRITVLEDLLTTLGGDDDPGPFRMLSWDEAHAMAQDGLVSLHPHAVTHPILSRCPDDKVEREVSESCATLQHETGAAPTIFAYPNGRQQDFDQRAVEALKRRNIRWAVSTTPGIAEQTSDPMALPRLPIGSNTGFSLFRVLVSGAFP